MYFNISEYILAFLQVHGYFILLGLMFVEGPIVTYVASFAASLGIFNVYFVWVISVFSSTLFDLTWYFIGRYGGGTSVYKYFIDKIGREKMMRIETFLINNPAKTIAVIKLTPTLPIPGFILSGAIKVPFRKFFLYSSTIVVVYSSLLVALGYYSGLAFGTASKYIKYGELLIVGTIITIIAITILARRLAKKISSRIEKI